VSPENANRKSRDLPNNDASNAVQWRFKVIYWNLSATDDVTQHILTTRANYNDHRSRKPLFLPFFQTLSLFTITQGQKL